MIESIRLDIWIWHSSSSSMACPAPQAVHLEPPVPSRKKSMCLVESWAAPSSAETRDIRAWAWSVTRRGDVEVQLLRLFWPSLCTLCMTKIALFSSDHRPDLT